MKSIVSMPIGGDGATASLDVDSGNLVAAVSFPIAKLLTPVNDLVDAATAKIEAAIPGDWDKAILDPIAAGLKAEIAALLSGG